MRTIFGVDRVEVVNEDGSPAGQKEWLIWNPPWIDPKDVTQGRISSISEASRVFRFLMDRGVRTIMFAKVRKSCELLIRQVRTDLMLEGRADMASKVMSYRSGYSPEVLAFICHLSCVPPLWLTPMFSSTGPPTHRAGNVQRSIAGHRRHHCSRTWYRYWKSRCCDYRRISIHSPWLETTSWSCWSQKQRLFSHVDMRSLPYRVR
jgi:hypothetical protein